MTQADYDAYRKAMDAAYAGDDAVTAAAAGAAADEYFSAAEIAAFLNIPVDEFFSRAAHGDLRPAELDGQHLYASKHVRRFLINLGVLEGDDQW